VKVIYDISVLGQGFYRETSRTGIFRAIESLGENLVAKGYITALSSGSILKNYFQCNAYLKTNPFLHNIELISPQLNWLYCNLLRSNFKLSHSAISQSFIAKVIGKTCGLLDNSLNIRDILNIEELTRFDIYHATFYPVPDEVHQIGNIRKIITIYDLIPVKYPEYCQQGIVSLVKNILESIRKDTLIACISQSSKDDLCDFMDIDPSRVFVTPLAASDNFYPCTDQYKIKSVKKNLGIPDNPYILSLATLEPRKNIATIIRSFYKLVQESKIDDLVLVLVGTKGWDFNEVFNEIESSIIQDRVIVTGYVDDEDLAPLYSGATVFVYPSLYEGFGLPPLEAMQCGVPVITSNTSSLPEVVGDAGIMLNPLDIDSICESIENIYSSQDIYKQMSAASISQAKKFSWEKCAEQTIEVYRAALSQ
jgi:glycosyltransferase involved in cell wall biosynthesis